MARLVGGAGSSDCCFEAVEGAEGEGDTLAGVGGCQSPGMEDLGRYTVGWTRGCGGCMGPAAPGSPHRAAVARALRPAVGGGGGPGASGAYAGAEVAGAMAEVGPGGGKMAFTGLRRSGGVGACGKASWGRGSAGGRGPEEATFCRRSRSQGISATSWEGAG